MNSASYAAGTNLSLCNPDVIELLRYYERWRVLYSRASRPTLNAPDWEKAKLYFREGYAHPDWSAYALQQQDSDIAVLRVSTERRSAPLEVIELVFSNVLNAGKYLLYKTGDSLRIEKRLDPLSWEFLDSGLHPAVEKQRMAGGLARYSLTSDPTAYFITGAEGISSTNWLLPLSYEELHWRLTAGFPDDVVAGLDR